MIKFIKKNYEKMINVLLVLFLINLIIYIFFGSRYLMNSDSSFIVDYSIEQINTKSFFPANWINTNDFWVYSLIPLITVFLKMGIGIFLSRQLSVFIQTGLMILIVVDLYKNCLKDKKGMKIVLLLLLSGVSGQFMFEIFGDATYGTIAFFMLLELWLFIKYIQTKKKKNIVFFAIILTLITACSMRFPIMIGAPIICYLLYSLYANKNYKENIILMSVIVGSILCGFLLNKYLCDTLILMSSYDARGIVSNYDDLASNIHKVLYNYFTICGASGQNVFTLTRYQYADSFMNNSSPFIVLTFLKYIFAFVNIYIIFALSKKIKKMKEEEKIIYIYVCSLHFILVFFLIICNMARWYRYITPLIFTSILLYPLFYNHCFAKELKKRVVFNIAIILFSIASVFFSTVSYFSFSKFSIRKNDYEEMGNFLLSKGLTFGYTLYGNESNVFRTVTEGKLQVILLTNNGRQIHQWLQTSDWFKEDYYSGKVFLYRQKSQGPINIEDQAIEKYEYNNFVILVFEDNKVILDNLKK